MVDFRFITAPSMIKTITKIHKTQNPHLQINYVIYSNNNGVAKTSLAFKLSSWERELALNPRGLLQYW
jgi:hypothetical protein